MVNKLIKWVPHVTQMGGFSIGTEKILGSPEFISTVPGFEKQDSYYKKYHNYEIKKLETDDFKFKCKVDLVVTNAPCSGISRLTSNTTCKEKISCQIDKIINITRQGLMCYEPKVLIGESSDGLFKNSGKSVREDLINLSKELGYSITFYNTDTIFHGLPQSRKRTFYIFWKSENSFVIGKIKEDYSPLKKFLENIDPGHSIINKSLLYEPTYIFLKEFKNINPRILMDDVKSKQKNTFQYILENNMLDDLINFFEDEGIKQKFIQIRDKKINGKNVILMYPRFWENHINGITWKNMERSVHPILDRSLTVREALHLMGFPQDYPEPDIGDSGLIGKNVPVNTASSLVKKVLLFFSNELKSSGESISFEDNNYYNKK